MLNNLRRKISLNNLRSNKAGGQIATILILITVVLIIFILSTINLGQTSVRATQVANAADSSTLYLASVLASRCNFYYEQLDDSTENCVKGGILPAVFAFIVALIVTICTWNPGVGFWTYAAIIASATVAGAIGGYIQTGELKGAAMGAITGFAIGCAFAAGAGLGLEIAAQVSMAMPGVAINIAPYVAIVSIAMATITTNAAMNELQDTMGMQQENLHTIYRSLSALPEVEAARESVFLMALSQVVDDPNKEPDEFDLDDDGDKDEEVSAFENWWWRRAQQIRADVKFPDNTMEEFFIDYWIPFFRNAKDFVRFSDRREVECNCSTSIPEDEGPITEFFRAIKDCGYNIFWEPGPSRSALLNWYHIKGACPTCAKPAGFDYFDGAKMKYEGFLEFTKDVLKPDGCGFFNYDLEELNKELKPEDGRFPWWWLPPKDIYDEAIIGDTDGDGIPDLGSVVPQQEKETNWLNRLYDPNSQTDYYDKFRKIAYGRDDSNGNPLSLGIQDWIDQIKAIRDQLPGCQLAIGLHTEFSNERVAKYHCNIDDYPDIYPCNWQRKEEPLAIGPYFPNPVCKLYDNIDVQETLVQDKSLLYNQTIEAENFVNNLTGNVTQIRLEGVLHLPCDKTALGTGTGTVTYIEDGVTKTAAIAAPDLHIADTDKDNFLLALTEFRGVLASTSSTFATIDQDLEDEFAETYDETAEPKLPVPILYRLESEITAIEAFRSGLKPFYDDMVNEIDNRQVYGAGQVKYEWAETDCPIIGTAADGGPEYEKCHRAVVRTGPFRFPYLKESHHESWGGLAEKDCVTIKSKDDLKGERTWVWIKRVDPGREKITSSAVDLGLRWNPGQDKVRITRISRAKWDENEVGLAGIWY